MKKIFNIIKMSIDIFIRSYEKDFKILKLCINRILDNLSGFRHLIISVPSTQYERLIKVLNLNNNNQSIIKLFTCSEFKNDYIGQQVVKLNSYKYTDADYIIFIDSDLIITQPTEISEFFTNDKPKLAKTEWEYVGVANCDANCWKQCLEKTNLLTDFETMRNLPLIYYRKTLINLSNYLSNLGIKNENELYNFGIKYNMSEFNLIGSYILKYENHLYEIKSTIDFPNFPDYKLKFSQYQKWSHNFNNDNESTLIINEILNLSENIEYHNNSLLIKNDSHFTNWVKETNDLVHDKYHTDIISKYIKQNDIVLDLGANIGTMTAFFLRKGCIVHSFEPHPLSFYCLKFNCFGANLYNFGCGNSNGKYMFNSIENGNIGMSKIIENGNIEIDVKKLDDLKIENVKFIKIDIEGFELEALKGLEKTIKSYKPIIDIEINDYTLKCNNLKDTDIYDFFKNIGYEPIEYIGEKPQVDVIFVSKS